jgi:hypothetical protein
MRNRCYGNKKQTVHHLKFESFLKHGSVTGMKNFFLYFLQALKKQKVNFVLRSTKEVVSSNTRVYVVDTLGM